MLKNFGINNNYNNQPTFSSWDRVVKKADNSSLKNKSYRNDTIWFRNGIPEIVDTLVDLYKDEKHVNTYIFGCSNGSEPTSMYIYMASKYGMDTVSKFTPFNAVDIDKTAIKKASSGHMPMEGFEYERALDYTYGKFYEFFPTAENIVANSNFPNLLNKTRTFKDGSTEKGICFKLKDEHAKNMKYSLGNILEDCKKINPNELSIVSARNFIPYLNNETITELFSNLDKQMKKGSTLILGDYDFCPRDREEYFTDFLNETLREHHFKRVDDDSGYVYIKQ